jgi:hypothetical protein
MTEKPKKSGMTLDEIKDAIKFEKTEIYDAEMGEDYYVLKAKLEIGSLIKIAKDSARFMPDWMDYVRKAKEHLRNEIIYTLFEARRKELLDAIVEFLKTDPYQFREYNEARQKLFRAAGTQPHKTIEEYLAALEEKKATAGEVSSSR